ncbi:quinone oxidoreductase family protein [Dactylosporangium matsuzakiense]|uniref:NADPH:quinone reductase n=1 Tax=Dactylosporangium matsuzakiense TaxID=53360 RepID=A0A9W6KNX4_9ACTN|nr:zinc-binding alcohol dehydrogenase family protein [Dactylosporangium matsuzakiense]GLL04593.1 NADPH:quinone reductase [Dactylosporangium matsuzakiense]
MRVLEMVRPGDADVLRFTERAAPTPGPGQVLVRVAYAGLNFTDVLARRGVPGYAGSWPFTPGLEIAGTVEVVGDGVAGLAAGDLVTAFTPQGGGYADLAVADARLTAPVPPGFDLATAAAMPLTWATALGLTRRAQAGPGDAVLVTSAGGGVGTALAAVLARQSVRTVVGGAGSLTKLADLAPGVVPVIRDDAFWTDAVAAAGSPFDVVLDSIGGVVLQEAAEHLAIGGRLVSYGAAAGQPAPQTPAYPALLAGNQTVSGFSMLGLARTAPHRVGTLIQDVVALVTNGLAVPAPAVVQWEQLIDAHVLQSEGKALGKTVVAIE